MGGKGEKSGKDAASAPGASANAGGRNEATLDLAFMLPGVCTFLIKKILGKWTEPVNQGGGSHVYCQ